MSDATERRRKREETWTARTFRGGDIHEALESDAEAEWARMSPVERLALSWQLSLEQYGGETDGEAMEPRLPRSAYRVERR
jgi:hypothetical protein